jgi:hypothetical protein
MRRPASLGLGVALGLGAGWLSAAPTRAPSMTPSTLDAAPAERTSASLPETPAARVTTPSASPVVVRPDPIIPAPASPTLAAVSGPSPPQVAPRFTEAQLRARFVEAFEEIETEGRIARVDCAEVPCIVFGEVPEADDLDNLVTSEAFSPYGLDALVQHLSEEAEDRFTFAVALFEPPTGARERDRVEARVQARIRMGGTFRGR